jgi:MFS transporter, DHA1 family, staphyloferrin A biosynthesis exporter
MLGTLNLVQSISSMTMLPAAGILIDRANHRLLMLLANGWMFLATLALGLILVFNGAHIGFLFAFAFIAGLAQSVDGTLRQVLVFDLVPRHLAPNAMALIQTGWSIMRSFGPSIGAFLILWIQPGGSILVQSAAYVLIAVAILQIRFPGRHSSGVRVSVIQNLKEGIQFIAHQKVTRTFALMGFILPLFIIPIFSTLPPIYAKDVFGGGADKLGYLMSAVGIGGVIGGFVVASLGRVERRGMIQLLALFLMALSLIGFALCKTLWAAFPMLVLAGFFEVIFLVTNQTLLQLSIPDELRGRVTSVVNLNAILMPLGGLAAGGGKDLLGGPQMVTIIMAGTAAVIAVLVFCFSPTVRNYRLNPSGDKI